MSAPYQEKKKGENIVKEDIFKEDLLRAKYSDGISHEFPISKIVLFEERWKIKNKVSEASRKFT